MMEEDIKLKKETQLNLLLEKKNLEKQIIDNLSFFNKISEPQSDRTGNDSIDIVSLMRKVQSLQSSVRNLSTARQEKRDKIATIITESLTNT